MVTLDSAEDGVITVIEVNVVRATRTTVVHVVVVRSRIPIVASANVAERGPFLETRTRKEEAVAVSSCNLIAINTVLHSPFPCAFVYQFL